MTNIVSRSSGYISSVIGIAKRENSLLRAGRHQVHLAEALALARVLGGHLESRIGKALLFHDFSRYGLSIG
jgi:hypothetical protein